MAKMTLSRICAPARPRVFLRHSDTRSRVLLKGGDYSDPVLNSGLYQWLDENLDTISPEVPIALSKAEQARVGR